MKNLFILILAFVCSIATAQRIDDMKSDSLTTYKTVTGSNTGYITSAKIANNLHDVSIQAVCSRRSGTAAGTLTLQASVDGTNYKAITDSTTVPQITTATLTNTVTQSFLWRVDGNPYPYYRVSLTTSGTTAVRVSAKIYSK